MQNHQWCGIHAALTIYDLDSLSSHCRWPDEPLRSVLVRRLSRLGVARFAQRYPALCETLLRSILELTVKYYKTGESRQPQT